MTSRRRTSAARVDSIIARLNRRHLLQIGSLGLFGLDLPRMLHAEESARAAAKPAASRIKSCILIFHYGGPSHIDTVDMKPDAPSEVRGEFKSIATSAPGIQICEHMPMTAKVMHHVSVIRSMHHPMRNHNAAAVEALCGRTPQGGDQELLADDAQAFPCYGSILNYVMRDGSRELTHVALPHIMFNVVQLPGQTAGFLGSSFERFQVENDPNSPAFNVSSLSLPRDVPNARLDRRKSLLNVIEKQPNGATSAEEIRPLRNYYQKAFDLLASEKVRQSLDIAQESAALRERYGRNRLGQSLLLARRLVESGVRFVTVFDGIHNGQDANWDSHQLVFPRHRDHLLPPADRGYSALIEDLATRGLLDSTLVISLGEFGRTPRINSQSGRDHWPDCFSVLLAGGGVKGGMTYGASDSIGAYPETDGVTPGDLAATLFDRFGVSPATEVHDLTGRPWRIAEGRPIEALFG